MRLGDTVKALTSPWGIFSNIYVDCRVRLDARVITLVGRARRSRRWRVLFAFHAALFSESGRSPEAGNWLEHHPLSTF